MADLNEAYSLMSPSEPSRGESTRMVYDEAERMRVSSPPTQPLPVAPITQAPLNIAQPQVAAQMKAKAAAAAAGPDRMREMRKILLYALIVLLGLALHHVLSDWLTRYLAKAYLSENAEQAAKLCYPACVLALIWILRTYR